ncbi:MAG: hypothetical protein MUE52_21365 [Tabrizicola sp.]|jgi:hypothetical protein|nr:hypothetical protein [Tabrizicola sp.]
MRRSLLAFALVTLAAPVLSDTTSPVKVAELSARLYAQGVEAGDPLLILSAAKLRKTLAPVASDRTPEGGSATDGAPLTWEEMLATAETLAADDAALMGLIDDVRAETTKGVASGPVYNIGNLSNGGGDTYPPIEFRGGEYAEVYVEAKAATNLNLTIYDDKGRLVCSDTDISHIAYCGWTPAQPGTFTLKVENKGPASAAYALMTN